MTPRASTPEQVLRLYYGLAGLYTFSASLVWGVNTLFLLAAGLDILEVFYANTAYTLAIVACEIPTGVVADTRGRRLSFLLSAVCLCTGTAVYLGSSWLGAGWLAFCFGGALLGLGTTFYSGATEAWLVDSLRDAGFQGALDEPLARGQLVTSGTTVVGTVAGGLLATLDLHYPYFLRAVLLGGLFFAARHWMHEVHIAPNTRRRASLGSEIRRVARASVDHGWRHTTVRALILVSLIHFSFLTWAFHAWQPYVLELLGQDAPWVAGVIAALITLATMAGNALVGWLRRRAGERRTALLLIAAAVQTGAAVTVGLADSFALAVAALLLMSAAAGVLGPVKQAALHASVPSHQRATILSFESLLTGAGGSAGQLGLGAQARAQGIAAAYVAGGLWTALALPVLARLPKTQPEDSLSA